MTKILIIEDDQRTAFALSVRLKAYGYTTWVAGDGITGIKMAVCNKPDLIVLDVSLPGGDGFALARQFNQLPETRDMPVILATASHDAELLKKAVAVEAVGLLRKPYDADDLLTVVEHAFGLPPRRESGGPLQNNPRRTSHRTQKKILIVEDDPQVAMGLALRMKSAGFAPTIANDALSGIRFAMSIRPDLVLLDVLLPAGSGFAVAERIQTNIPTPTAIMFLTAGKSPELRAKARQLGAVDFFEKPYEAEALLAAIKQALA